MGADLVEPRCADRAVVPGRANLDQFVRVQRPIDFGQNCRRQAVRSDHDHRPECVGLGFQDASRGGIQMGHGVNSSSRTGLRMALP